MSQSIFKERRSVNNFDSSKSFSRDKLRQIIDLAVYAPSAFNLEPWRVIAVETDEAKEKLMALANGQPKVADAAYTLIIVGDRSGYDGHNPAWAELETMVGPDYTNQAREAAASLYGSSEERKIKFAESNAGLLGMSIMYAAQALEVDSHPMSGIDFEGIKSGFGLKEGEEAVMLIALGYRDESKKLYPRRSRKGFDSLVELI